LDRPRNNYDLETYISFRRENQKSVQSLTQITLEIVDASFGSMAENPRIELTCVATS